MALVSALAFRPLTWALRTSYSVNVPLSVALMFFIQQLGGSVFISVGRNIFSSQLAKSLSEIVSLDTDAIINTGATALRSIVTPSELSTVVNAYSYALTRVFILAAVLSAYMILGVLAVEWKSIKAEKNRASKNAKANSGEAARP